jgi:hypothetical protein
MCYLGAVRGASLIVLAMMSCQTALASGVIPTFSLGPVLMPQYNNTIQNNNSVVAADFNGDGILDIATPNFDSFSRRILITFGTPGGGYSTPVAYPGPDLGLDIGAGDFDGDGHLDIAAVGYNGVEVLYGNGAGNFFAQFFPAPFTEYHGHLAIGDLTGDGIPDVVTTGSYLTAYLGRSSGGLSPPIDLSGGSFSPQCLALGDINNDGRLDIVFCDGFSLASKLNQGGMMFSPAHPLAPTTVRSVAIADLNHDGNLDIAYTNPFGAVSVAMGLGNGAFLSPVTYPGLSIGGGQTFVSIVDINNDGQLDLVMYSQSDSDAVFLLNTGAGSFGAPQHFATGVGPFNRVASGDFDRDGDTDLVFANYFGGVRILFNSYAASAQAIPVFSKLVALLMSFAMAIVGCLSTKATP